MIDDGGESSGWPGSAQSGQDAACVQGRISPVCRPLSLCKCARTYATPRHATYDDFLCLVTRPDASTK